MRRKMQCSRNVRRAVGSGVRGRLRRGYGTMTRNDFL